MPRAKPRKPDAPPPAAASPDEPKADRVFVARKTKTPPSLTHERIAEDMAAFRKAGGKVEVLGNTRTLTRIGASDDAPPPLADKPAQRKR